MKLLLILLLLLNQGITGANLSKYSEAGDRVLIEEGRVVLKRGVEGQDYKEAVVRYPRVKGLKNSAVLRKVQTAMSMKSVFGNSLDELRAEFKESWWLSEVNYEVNYNKHFILDITFSQSGVGAYPDEVMVHRIVNLKTGNVLKAADVFRLSSLKMIVGMVNEAMRAEVQQAINEWKQRGADVKDMFESVEFRLKDLDNFSVSDEGVTFLYDFGFPHVSKAVEPPGQYFFSYEKLKTHLKREGLLGLFLRRRSPAT